jgi:hypothetical protein
VPPQAVRDLVAARRRVNEARSRLLRLHPVVAQEALKPDGVTILRSCQQSEPVVTSTPRSARAISALLFARCPRRFARRSSPSRT